ncbi:hypothetical protein [Luteimonas sp. R10]|uniref:hypothetical protein n=1 Tax=Luteimonas sp. R10 TaxID=3108176 RepID=UPI003090C9D3|nr:hypothetical protein U3649_11160 [Luteimonas sp. R10]
MSVPMWSIVKASIAAVVFAAMTSACSARTERGATDVGASEMMAPDQDASHQAALTRLERLLDYKMERPQLGDVAWLFDLSTVQQVNDGPYHGSYTVEAKENALGIKGASFTSCMQGVDEKSPINVMIIEFSGNAHAGEKCVDIRALADQMNVNLQPPRPTPTAGLSWIQEAFKRSGNSSLYLITNNEASPCMSRANVGWGRAECK